MARRTCSGTNTAASRTTKYPFVVAEYGVGTSDDNEWLHGYDLQFGIIYADRSIKPSSELLRQEAKLG